MKYSLIYFSIVFFVFSCTSVETSPLVLSGKLQEGSKSMSREVKVKVPNWYKKAETYDGFQTQNRNSSISLQVNRTTIEFVNQSFDPARLSKKKVKLLSKRPVDFAGNKKALYTEVLDHRKDTKRYALSIEDNGMVYSIKGFCFQDQLDAYEEDIRTAIFSTHFVDKNDLSETPLTELFTLANIDLEAKIALYTRDGKIPDGNESADKIEFMQLDHSMKSHSSWEIEKRLRETFKQITGQRIESFSVNRLDSGIYSKAYIKEGEVKFLALYFAKYGNPDQFLLCSSKDEASFQDFDKFIEKEFFTTTIGF